MLCFAKVSAKIDRMVRAVLSDMEFDVAGADASDDVIYRKLQAGLQAWLFSPLLSTGNMNRPMRYRRVIFPTVVIISTIALLLI